MPPTTTTTPHHPRQPHPPPRRGGERTEDTPPHEEHGETLTHTTAPDPTGNSARHDSSTRQHCSGMSSARATPLHRGRTAAAHTTAIAHTEEDGHHPLIHSSLSLIRVHTTDDQR